MSYAPAFLHHALPPFSEQLKTTERLRVLDIFRRNDTDGDGGISLKELREFATVRKLELEPGQLEAIMTSLDQDGNGTIDFEEFKTACDLFEEHARRSAAPARLKVRKEMA